ncbi:Uncharacterized conserved protein, DUF2147 family [Faunimonas pinastri]|uniref:Uncharacterized conserved protein, DUF2147 family n=1 Tax=Faunimonas pinastri TaxID=1855383 RepID=A0A1H9GHV0_9HYPH|nr:DUF2147 domain-containing protein [Faunimonas pinastri]SEQ49657.1 Uncharacterized conserved protein, DUF2147 family [Faunimonas pinastri]
MRLPGLLLSLTLFPGLALVSPAVGFAASAPPVPAPAPARPADPINGVWKQIDDKTHAVGALIRFEDQDGTVSGKIIKIYPAPGDPPNPVCTGCKGEEKNTPLVGFTLIRGMIPQGDGSYKDGTITDPDSGDDYHAQMKLSPDGQSLTLRGYLLVPLFGRSQIWQRAS